jgi:adenylate kinase
MKILLIGPPASGKGTVGEKLSERLNIPLISVGELLRAIPESNPLKKKVDEVMESGELVPQEIVAKILKEEVSKESAKNGFIFDGWGRKREDLDFFDPDFDKVVLLEISPETALKRIASRRTCEKCGAVFNVEYLPPKKEGVCDFCEGRISKREDESEETTKRRLRSFYSETKETIDFYKKNGKLLEIDAEGTPDLVFDLVLKALAL